MSTVLFIGVFALGAVGIWRLTKWIKRPEPTTGRRNMLGYTAEDYNQARRR